MKVAEYHRRGLQHFTPTPPTHAVPLGTEARDGVHRVAFFGQISPDGRLTSVFYTASKRCRKLLALADVAATRLEGQPAEAYTLHPQELLDAFAEERDQQKMQARIALILQALNLSEDAG